LFILPLTGGFSAHFLSKKLNNPMKLKSLMIMGLILLSLLPLFLLYKWLQVKMKPRHSLQHFFGFMAVMFVIVFSYTFLLVFGIRLLFSGA